MLISRKPVQRGGIGEKCGVFLRYSAPAIAKGLGSLMLGVVVSVCTWLLDDVIRNYSQLPYLAQHSITTLLRHCFEWLQHCSNIATLCCAKNRRCESSRVTSPSSNDDIGGNENGRKAIALNWQHNNVARAAGFFENFFAITAELPRETS